MSKTREKISVLVVDDVNAMRLQVKDLMVRMGFRWVRMAANAQEALAAIEEQETDLVLLDWKLGGQMSGLDLLKQIRADAKHAKMCVAMVTAANTRDDVLVAIQAGIDAYLVKPLTQTQIETKVYTLLAKKQVIA